MGELADRAEDFARRAHEGQQYGAGDFHAQHLRRVVDTLKAFGETDETLLTAAWLHDTVEDTAVSVEDVRSNFGDDVADLVWRLTDETGRNRRERHSRTREKIRARSAAVRVKLADRIANVESGIVQRSHLFGMYRKEHPDFRRELYRAGEFEDMWKRLDDLLQRRSSSERGTVNRGRSESDKSS